MANLIINVRCTCEEEFLLLHKLHKLYQEDQLRQRLAKRMNTLTVDGVQKEVVAVQGNGDGTESFTVKPIGEPRPEMVAGAYPERFPKTTLEEVLEAEAENDDGCNGEDYNFCA